MEYLPHDPLAPKPLPKPGPRKPLSKFDYATMFLEQSGKCFCCSQKLAKGQVIDEHIVPRDSLAADKCDDLENRKLFCKPCAKAKTVGDAATVAKTRRVTGGRGSQRARRERRGEGSIRSPAASKLSKDHPGYRNRGFGK